MIPVDVESASGTQTFSVISDSPEKALEIFNNVGGDFEEEEVEVIGLAVDTISVKDLWIDDTEVVKSQNKELNSHDIAKELLSMPPKKLVISTDISTCDKDSDRRSFTDEYFGINDMEDENEVVLLFSGSLNT